MIQYILECVAFQLVFLVIYDLFLKRETFFQWNRLYLIATYVLSLLLPWIKIEALKTSVPETFQDYPEFLWNLNNTSISASAAAETEFNIPWEFTILFGGMVMATLLFGYKLYQIHTLKREGQVEYFKDFTRIIVANSTLAFSFFNSIFLGDKVLKKEHQSIVQHELVHIRQRHSYDLMFFEMMRIVGWFNPLVYLYQNRISELHEFIADAQVAKTHRKEQYQLLLSQVFQTESISFINQFFKKSLIKKRIVMLTKEKSKQILQLKYLLLIPIIISMLFYTSCQKDLQGTDTIVVEDVANLTLQEEAQVFDRLLQLSESSDDWKLFVKDEFSSMKFVKSDKGSFLSGPNGEKIFAKLAIDSKLGKSKTNLFAGLGESEDLLKQLLDKRNGNDSELDKAIAQYNQLVNERQRLIKSSSENNPIIVNLDQQINGIKKSIDNMKGQISNQDSLVPFAVVEEVPVFPGCEGEIDKRACFNKMIQKHISKHFNYPKEAQEKGIQGRVNIIFTIGEDGVIKNLRLRGPDKVLEDEAKRIISRLPKLKPGVHEGKKVNVPFSIPITFKLSSNSEYSNIKLSLDHGTNPAYIIDGVEAKKAAYEAIDENNIESIFILNKEASIKKYGQNGKNGVIVVKTKKQE